MIGRFIGGALIGAVLGLLVAALAIKGVGLVTFSAAAGVVFAYLLAAAAGALTGLFAGKPIWAAGGRIEAGLKAVFGAVFAMGGMFALRTWAPWSIDLAQYGAGAGAIGDLPAASLPIITMTLGALFGLDNTPDSSDKEAGGGGKKVRVAKGAAGAAADEIDDETDAGASRRQRR